MNKYEIQINGKISIDEPINPDTEYSIALKRVQNDCGKVSEYIDKMDRKVFCYKLVNLDIATLISGDTIIGGKAKKSSPSQALRFKIFDLFENQYAGGDEDKETFYNNYMQKIIKSVEDKLV